MTKHERQIIAEKDTPPMDANGRPFAIDPRFDVAQIATRGHVLTARVRDLTRKLFWPVALVGVFTAYSLAAPIFFGPMYPGRSLVPSFFGLSTSRAPEWISNALTYNPDTYFSLGGGLRGGPELAFMADYAPQPDSLSKADYDALMAALRNDTAAHGVKPADWTAIGDLKVKPQITRPEKVLTNYSDRLKTGVISVNQYAYTADVIAHVEGQWVIASAKTGDCAVFLGPVADGCRDLTNGPDQPINENARTILGQIAPKAEQKQD